MTTTASDCRTEPAPVAVFAYNRPHHLSRLLDSLLANAPFARSPVFVFCDGPRTPADAAAVEQTRAVVRQRIGDRAQVMESSTNRGLARSIVAGVTELCERFGRVIVLEDDLILGADCLDFLNAALERYADDEKVYHVNAYRYPGPIAPAPTFCRLPSSWGWATWRRAWKVFEPDSLTLQRDIERRKLTSTMDFGGTFPYYKMLQLQSQGRIDSWAIRWYASVLLRGGLAVYPNVSLVRNGGFDDSGVHCATTSKYDVALGAASMDWPREAVEDLPNFREMQRFFRAARESFPRRVLRRVRRVLQSAH